MNGEIREKRGSLALLCLGLLWALPACGDDGDSSTDSGPQVTIDSGAGAADAQAASDAQVALDAAPMVAIPDPATGMGNDWFAVEGTHSTPGTAWPVGVATFGASYIEGTGDATGAFFYVFEAGPKLTSFVLSNVIDFPEFHLHNGDGLLFGSLITPTESTAQGGTWTVTPGSVYVLELAGGPEGFF